MAAQAATYWCEITAPLEGPVVPDVKSTQSGILPLRQAKVGRSLSAALGQVGAVHQVPGHVRQGIDACALHNDRLQVWYVGRDVCHAIEQRVLDQCQAAAARAQRRREKTPPIRGIQGYGERAEFRAAPNKVSIHD